MGEQSQYILLYLAERCLILLQRLLVERNERSMIVDVQNACSFLAFQGIFYEEIRGVEIEKRKKFEKKSRKMLHLKKKGISLQLFFSMLKSSWLYSHSVEHIHIKGVFLAL